MATQIKLRRDTAANWASNNPTPAQGEPCWAYDTGVLKIGDGTTAYNSLDAFSSGVGGGGYTYVQSGAPVSPSVGETWFDLDTSNTYLRYDDGGGAVWMQSGTVSGGGSSIDVDVDQRVVLDAGVWYWRGDSVTGRPTLPSRTVVIWDTQRDATFNDPASFSTLDPPPSVYDKWDYSPEAVLV